MMNSRAAYAEQPLDLPPGYTLVALREHGDAFAHGCDIADEAGAGTLVWVRRYDLVEFAVVLEPDEPLTSARRAFFAGMNATADAIAAHCPPERQVEFRLARHDPVRRRRAGRGAAWLAEGLRRGQKCRRGWCSVSSCARRTWRISRRTRQRAGVALLSEGFEMIDTEAIIGSFARHLMTGIRPME